MGSIKVKVEKEMIESLVSEGMTEREWKKVVEEYRCRAEAHTTRTTGYKRGTALHVALHENEEQVAEQLLEAILSKTTAMKALEMGDESGDTALHVAASKGMVRVCKRIVGDDKEREHLVKKKNEKGETPLFVAALNWNRKGDSNKSIVAYFIRLLQHDTQNHHLLVRHDHDTLLHVAITRQYFDLAIIILHYYEFLGSYINNEGKSPLQALADVPSAFRSGTNIFGWSLILYHCISIPRFDPEGALVDRHMRSKENIKFLPENYYSCALLYKALKKLFQIILWGIGRCPEALCLGCKIKKSCETHEISYDHSRGWLPPNYTTVREFINALVAGFVGLSGLGRFGYDSIKMKKERNKWSRQLLREFLKKPNAEEAMYGRSNIPSEYDSDILDVDGSYMDNANYKGMHSGRGEGSGSKASSGKEGEKVNSESAFVIAAKNGIVEMVNDILEVMPNAIYAKSNKKQNVLVTAVEERQPFVFVKLKKHLRLREHILEDLLSGPVDGNGNTILHLAAKAVSGNRPGQIVGDALQMMWDIKWYEYIKEHVPEHYESLANNPHEKEKKKEKETPIEIFREEHKELIKNGSSWLKETSDSCSVVAALIAGVSFATAYTVPGGNNDGGESPFEDEPVFKLFAVSALVGLGFSVTALTMFLSILTSRKSAKDFLGSLPGKLLFGLSSLFISIMAMFVSFCSGHYFLVDKSYKPGSLFLLYGATAFPVIFFAIAQLPLYYDLLLTFLFKAPHKAKGLGTAL